MEGALISEGLISLTAKQTEVIMNYAKRSWIRSVLVSVLAFSLPGLSAAQAQDRHVRVINASPRSLVSFYASNIWRPGWEEDIFGLGTLPPGQSILINIDDGTGYCRFDLKAVFSNGAEVVRYNVNVCGVESWTIYD